MGLFEAIRSSLKPKADTVALVERLAKRQVPFYCLSNMPASTFSGLRGQHAFWSAFRGIVILDEIKVIKPQRELEHLLLAE